MQGSEGSVLYGPGMLHRCGSAASNGRPGADADVHVGERRSGRVDATTTGRQLLEESPSHPAQTAGEDSVDHAAAFGRRRRSTPRMRKKSQRPDRLRFLAELTRSNYFSTYSFVRYYNTLFNALTYISSVFPSSSCNKFSHHRSCY